MAWWLTKRLLYRSKEEVFWKARILTDEMHSVIFIVVATVNGSVERGGRGYNYHSNRI